MANVNIRVQSISSEEQQTGIPTTQKESKSGGANPAVASLFVHQAISTGKQILNYGISNIGNFTGDYVKQAQIQQGVDIATDIAGIGIAFATNWVAGLVAVVGVATKGILSSVSAMQEQKHLEHNTSYLIERSGNSTKNGSRTGD